MTGRCPLCASERLEAGDVTRRLVDDHSPDRGAGGRPDYVALKRELEADLGLELTVSTIKRHVDEHITHSWKCGGQEVSS